MLEQFASLPHDQYFIAAAEVTLISLLQTPLAARVHVASVLEQQVPVPENAEDGQKVFPRSIHCFVQLS